MSTLNVKENANCPTGEVFRFSLLFFLTNPYPQRRYCEDLKTQKNPCTSSSWKKKGDGTQHKSPIPMEIEHCGISRGITMSGMKVLFPY